jgi:hypothetical protein
MKLVKLNKRHKLFRDEGCVYAWRFEGFNANTLRVELFFESKFGDQWSSNGRKKWRATFGSKSYSTLTLTNGRSYKSSRTTYWIGIKDPKDLPFLLLQINDLQQG